MSARRLILRTLLSPGDVCTLTAAIESLHATYPGQYLTAVRTSCDALFEHNPHVTPLGDGDGELLEMHNTDLINRSDDLPTPSSAATATTSAANTASRSSRPPTAPASTSPTTSALG